MHSVNTRCALQEEYFISSAEWFIWGAQIRKQGRDTYDFAAGDRVILPSEETKIANSDNVKGAFCGRWHFQW